MIAEKRSILQPLIDSSDGIHLTSYLVRDPSGPSLEEQLKETLKMAKSNLQTHLNDEQLHKFLKPIEALVEDPKFLNAVKGNVGIFRSRQLFRILMIPIDMKPISVISTSFHVKPLLRWMQIDRDFLTLHLEAEEATLYLGSQSDFICKEKVAFSSSSASANAAKPQPLALLVKRRIGLQEKIDCLVHWMSQHTLSISPRLFVTGDRALCEGLLKKLNAPYASKAARHVPLHGRKLGAVCLEIRALLRKEARMNVEQAFLEFRSAEEINLGEPNIFLIAKAAVEGRIKKLIVADGVHFFGKINPITGSLSVNRSDTQHSDDDILDDLAQIVLQHGGEVVVAHKAHVPRGRPALAILYDQGSEANLCLPYYNVITPPEWRVSV